MARYVFNMKTGHYHAVLNEADDVQQSQNTQATQQATQQATPNETADKQTDSNMQTIALPNLDTEAVTKIEKEQDNQNRQFDLQIQTKRDNALQLQQQLSAAVDEFNVEEDPDAKMTKKQTIVGINDKLLQIELEISNINFKKAEQMKKYEQQAIQLKQQANESMRVRKIPAKYKKLNESNINTAKIYLKNLVANDDDHLLKSMHDVKRAFANSDLLYGKDKNGVFVVCVDQQDFDRAYDTLEEVGYLRDQIFDTIMPQLFNRQDMVM